MIKKCSKCGAFKELTESNFRYFPKVGRYCAYCKACEAHYMRIKKEQERKRRLINMFLYLTRDYSEADVDNLFNTMKTSWRAKREKGT